MGKRTVKTPEPAEGDEAVVAIADPPITRLDQVFGHARAKEVLQASMQSGRVHHSWIFHGPVGIGKKATAVAFAAALLDPTLSRTLSGELAPEEGSPVQRLIESGTHPDFRVVNKEMAALSRDDKTRGGKQVTLAIEVVREFVVEPAARSRMLTGESLAGKVFVIDEAEMMDLRTQNVLLKTLEEPPAGCVIILVTSSEDRLLATIRSRSQRVGFTPLTDMEMQQWLHARGAPMSEESKAWVLRFAAGSPGMAKLAIEQDLHAWQVALGDGFDQVARGTFPLDLGAKMAALVEERAKKATEGNPEASKEAANKMWARRMLGFVAEDARGRLRARGMRAGVSAAAGREDAALARAVRTLDAVSEAEGHLASNVGLALVFEHLAAQMAGSTAGVLS